MANICSECGFPLQGNEEKCPECGCPNERVDETIPPLPQPSTTSTKTDWANYIYECSVIAWRVFVTKYATFTGRASRREFWSFCLIIFLISCVCGLALVTIIPAIAVCIRRLHDINRCGWWCCVPFACFFMYLKQSDKEENNYGEPFEANQYLN